VHVLLADLIPQELVEEFIKYALYVLGGYVVGNLATLIICRIAAYYWSKQRMGLPLERALRTIGGFIVAAIVALFMFPAGWGRGGPGTGQGEGEGGKEPGSSREVKDKQPSKLDPKTKEEEAILATSLKVTIQKATDYPKTFRFNGESEGLDLAAAKKKLKELRDASGRRLQLLELRVYKDSTESGHVDVREFLDYAHGLEIHTRVEKLGNRPE
jgi:hypothetical protein